MQTQYFELDPRGDVLLILRQPNQHEFGWSSYRSRNSIAISEPDSNAHGSVESGRPTAGADDASADDASASDQGDQVQFLVSSRHLSLASPVFDAMLSGGWKESTILDERPRKIARLENGDISNSELQKRHEISATEWNSDALLLLMNIIHGHHRKLPDEIDPAILAHFAILVDYYKCHEITEVFARLWIAKNIGYLPPSYREDTVLWIFVSWIFSNAEIFEQMTEQAIRESKGPVNAMGLPLPLVVLNAIEGKKKSAIQKILFWLEKHREGLIKGNARMSCGFECSSMLLGTLIKGMEQYGINERQLLDPGSDRSIKQIKKTLLDFQTPAWYSLNDHSQRPQARHSCNIVSILEPGIDNIWKSLKGLKLDDYRV